MNAAAEDIVYPGSDQYSAAALAAPGSQPLEPAGEPLVRVDNTAYILFEVPELTKQRAFLEDFGLQLASDSGDALYFRGSGTEPYCYVARRGANARFLGAGFSVLSRAELENIAGASGRAIEPLDGPGGGERVRLHDPDGFIVDIVHGRERVEPLPVRREMLPVNTPTEKHRVNRGQRPPLQPAAIERFGHYVLMVSDFQRSWQWYQRHLGILATDVLCGDDGTPLLAFNRLDRGEKPADHHTVVLLQGIRPAYMHSAYETLDADSIGQGQQYLKMRGWNHFWGIGRHILGSQIFDYWLDPFGHEVEHYADGDVFDSNHPTAYHLMDRGGLWAWGADVPASVRPRPTLRELLTLLRRLAAGNLDRRSLAALQRAMGRAPRPWLK